MIDGIGIDKTDRPLRRPTSGYIALGVSHVGHLLQELRLNRDHLLSTLIKHKVDEELVAALGRHISSEIRNVYQTIPQRPNCSTLDPTRRSSLRHHYRFNLNLSDPKFIAGARDIFEEVAKQLILKEPYQARKTLKDTISTFNVLLFHDNLDYPQISSDEVFDRALGNVISLEMHLPDTVDFSTTVDS